MSEQVFTGVYELRYKMHVAESHDSIMRFMGKPTLADLKCSQLYQLLENLVQNSECEFDGYPYTVDRSVAFERVQSAECILERLLAQTYMSNLYVVMGRDENGVRTYGYSVPMSLTPIWAWTTGAV